MMGILRKVRVSVVPGCGQDGYRAGVPQHPEGTLHNL